jgi:3-hydroxyacyl-CoA dehydrogenase/enoyl-CoA hydratase/3-hydroxybutyryl-CoA epimerase
VIRSVVDADVCAVVGWNFPAYTGGPLSLIDTVGLKAFIADCRHLAEVYGDQFLPPKSLIDMQKEGKHFYHRG